MKLFKSKLLPFAYLAVYVGWGTTYLAIRVGVQSMGPATFLGLRFLIAAFVLLPILIFQKQFKNIQGLQWFHSAIQGFLLLFCGLLPTAYAEKNVPSHITAIIIGCAPLAFALFDWLLNGVSVRRTTILGFIFGIFGILMLNFEQSSGTHAMHFSLFDLSLVIFGCSMWAFASVFNKKLKPVSFPLMNVFVQYLAAGIVLIIAAFSAEGFELSQLNHLKSSFWYSLLYISIIPSLLSYTAYIWLLKNEPSSRVSTYAFVNPIVAVLAGALILSEPVSWNILSALCFVILGAWLNFKK